jgi:GT2 family glycosyltransferase
MIRKGQTVVRTKSKDATQLEEKLFIGTLGIDCVNYSKACIDSVKSRAKEVFFCYMDNGSTDESLEEIRAWQVKNPDIHKFEVVENGCNAGVGVGWNMLITKALEWGATKILICNNDISFGKFTLDGLCEAYDKLREGNEATVMVTAANKTKIPAQLDNIQQEWDYNEHPDFSCFMITPESIDRLGMFSEEYKPAYFEDNDMHHRILLSGYKAWSTDWAPYSHIASRTRASHPDIVPHALFRANRQQFYNTFKVTGPDQEIEDERYQAYIAAHPGTDPHPQYDVVLDWALAPGNM